MKLIKQPLFFLLGICLFAFLLRYYQVTSIPPALSWDEVSIGNNAWSIYKTGRDEHGRFMPIDTFVAYGDYKPPVAVYVTVPSVAVFGLNEFGVRFPVIIFATLSVALTYMIVRELFASYKYVSSVALLSAFLMAISPWHINVSRAGFEAVIALFFMLLGIVCTVYAKKKQQIQLFLWIPFVIAIYTFNSSRYVVPLFAPVVIWYVYGEKISGLFSMLLRKKAIAWEHHAWTARLLLSVVIAGILLFPLIPHLLSPEARLRFKEVNIFSDESIVRLSNERIEAAGGAWWANILNNRRVGYAVSYVKHYLDHFEPSFLFIKGDGNPKFSIQDVGQLYAIEAIFLISGWVAIFFMNKRAGVFLLLWLLIAIIPAGVARETPHALRILNTLPTWQIAIACSIIYYVTSLKKKWMKNIVFLMIAVLYVFSFAYYIHSYYSHYPYEFSGEWQYGYKQALKVTEQLKDSYDHIIVSELIGRAYAYTLFYGQYDPNYFLKTKKSYFDAAGFYTVEGFGKYLFVKNELPKISGKTLYVLPPERMPQGFRTIESIRLLNGVEILRVFD